jgi:hypothetical protein
MPKTKRDGATRQDEASPVAMSLEQQKASASLPRIVVKRVPGVRRARISPETRAAMELMAHEGISLPMAAQRVGMLQVSLERAMQRPVAKAAYSQLVKQIRENAAQSAYLRINHLGQVADSETVKLEANKWIAGVDNIAPVRRVEGRYQVSHSFGGFMFDDDGAVDVTPDDTSSATDDE